VVIKMQSEFKANLLAVLVVLCEILISVLVGGAFDTYGKDNTLAGVILFLGLEVLRHWRKYENQRTLGGGRV